MQRGAINGAITPCAGDKVAVMICGMEQTPTKAAEDAAASPGLPSGDDERFAGYGVTGLPFASVGVIPREVPGQGSPIRPWLAANRLASARFVVPVLA